MTPRRIRVIPTLLISRTRGGLVKGVQFRKHVYVGDPINAVKVFNDKGVDEIAVIDIDATQQRRPPDFDWVEDICSEAFMPLAYGGGISHIDHVREILQRGAEKIVLNTAAVGSERLVSQAAKLAGSQSVVVSIDAKKSLLSGYRAYTHAGSVNTRIDPVTLSRRMEEAGAGEILLTSITCEGSMSGYDLELLRQVTQAVHVPVIANGGGGTTQHFVDAVHVGGASAVAAGSMFVFVGRHRAVLINYPNGEAMQRLFRSV